MQQKCFRVIQQNIFVYENELNFACHYFPGVIALQLLCKDESMTINQKNGYGFFSFFNVSFLRDPQKTKTTAGRRNVHM